MDAPPLHDGPQPVGPGWTITPPYPMALREEEGATVLWHSPRRLTLWINVFAGDAGASADDTLAAILADRSEEAFDECVERSGGLLRSAYRIEGETARCASFYGFGIAADGGYVLLGAYFDDEESLEDVLAAWRSIRWKP